MNTEEKIKAILEAIASKKVSARKIDVSRKGSTIAAIKRGQTVKPATVDKLYATLLSILAGSEPHETQEKIPPTEEQAKQEPTKDDDSLSTRVEILEGWNVEIKKMLKELALGFGYLKEISEQTTQTNVQMHDILSRVEALESAQKAQIPAQTTQPTHTSDGETRILGFKIVKKNTSSRLADGSVKKYEKWYAVKQGRTVYLGETPDNAETKIKTYCLNKAIALEAK